MPRRSLRSARPVSAVVLALVLTACGQGEDGGAEQGGTEQGGTEQGGAGQGASAATQRVGVPPSEDLSTLENLSHVGYVDFGEPGKETGAGVVLDGGARVSPGYTLVTSLPNSRASLIDNTGHEVANWTDPAVADARFSRVEILRNGDVLCVSPKADFLSRMGFDGRLIWRLPLEVHHDAIELPDGRILVLERRFRVIPAIDAKRRCVDNLLTFVSSDGQKLAEFSLYDLLLAEPRVLTVEPTPGAENLPAGYNLDPLHANTVFWIARPELAAVNPLFQIGRVLVTIRYLDSVALFDLEQKRCVWAFGAGELQGPHDASVLANGHILVLDNGYDERGWSRVVELDPLSGRIVWQYRAPEPKDFFTSGRGTVQALPNGDVLVGNSNSGEAFEITRAGEIVWRYLNPFVDERGARGVIRVERYEPAFVAPFLTRKK